MTGNGALAAEEFQLLDRLQAAIVSWRREGVGCTSTVTGGGAIRRWEERVAGLVRVDHSVALSSGTLALRVALAAVGVGPGSDVLVPAWDWPAAVAACVSLSARPVPIDLDFETLGISPDAVARAVHAGTAAVVVTHLFGFPADTVAIRSVTDPLGIPVVEDAAQALGATLDGRPVGGIGTAGVLSFGPGKFASAGEGGMVVTSDLKGLLDAVSYSQHPVRQLLAGVPNIVLDNLSARVHPAAAILGLHELDQLGDQLARCAANAAAVRERLAGIAGVRMAVGSVRSIPNWHRVPVLIEDLDVPTRLERRGLRLDASGACPVQGADLSLCSVATSLPGRCFTASLVDGGDTDVRGPRRDHALHTASPATAAATTGARRR